ncbi:MAG: transcription antitermination factor NusB [Candidatus Zixiibacteriota bacterium]|nr:MAG: transcription antitermination factor NusB [candidate division Zixibacteria bacterium]
MTRESSRSRARELVLQTLYACEHGESEPDVAFDDITRENPLSDRNTGFARNLLHLVIENSAAADKHIAELAENWKLERIAAIDRSILRMAMTELAMITDTPVKVVLNEAIELAKKYSTLESSKFVNGILDNFVKQQRQLK